MAPYNAIRSFEALPFDIHYEVVRYLDFMSALNLASANRYFHQTINPRTSLPKEECKDFIGQRDLADVNRTNDRFACYQCFRFLPQEKFAKKATTDRTGKRGELITRKKERTCFDCAGKYRLYDHLRPISNGKLRYYFCHNCGQYKTKSARCEGPRLDIDNIGAAKAVALCGIKAKQPARLEILPAHILKEISSYLGLDDALRFASVSHSLRDTVQPLKWVPLHTRYRFVHDKWHTEVLDIDTDAIKTYPCYTCCRVRPKAKFTPIQIKKAHKYPETMWKMRCQSCLQKMYRGGKNPTRIEHRRRHLCEICKCLSIRGKTCRGCLELYVKGGIDRGTMYPANDMRQNTFDYADLVNDYDGMFEDGNLEDGDYWRG